MRPAQHPKQMAAGYCPNTDDQNTNPLGIHYGAPLELRSAMQCLIAHWAGTELCSSRKTRHRRPEA